MIRDQETINQLVDLIERFVRERLVPNEERLAEEGKLPEDILEEMKALGLFGLTIPEEYGGLGLTMEEEILVAIALGRTLPAFRSIMGTNNGIGSAAVVFNGTEAQKQKYLPKYASGEWISCFLPDRAGCRVRCCLFEDFSGQGRRSLYPQWYQALYY
jgi:acyl-CoA dehydrogenase